MRETITAITGEKVMSLSTEDRHGLLDTLANFMEDLPMDRCHMPEWCGEGATETHCGATGCAAGWTATLFHRHGFILRKTKWWKGVRYPYYLGAERTAAFADFFGITDREAVRITATFSYVPTRSWDITPRMVAERIREVLRDYPTTKIETEKMMVES